VTSAGRILLVEDNPANRQLAVEVLERDGFTVEVVVSAEAAIQSLDDHRPDLILMDIQLPGEDGLGLTRQLKTQPSTEAIPVVALSAHAMAEAREEAMAAGCAGYITKPIDTRTLGQQVMQFLAAQPQPTINNRHSRERSQT
jgi:CheY-like chemotaxis protein